MISWMSKIPIHGGSLSTIIGDRLSSRRMESMTSEFFQVPLADNSILTGEIDFLRNMDIKANILLVHGLGSSCHDPSIVRQSRYLAKNGFKVFRLNHRNTGSGRGKAVGFYHGFRGADLRDALAHLQQMEPCQKWILISHSLSGNMVMKIAGMKPYSDDLKSLGCVGVAAISPVVDLATSSRTMHKPMFGIFDKVFMKKIERYIKKLENIDDALRKAASRAKGVAEFDEFFLVPALGLSKVDEYYNLASSMDVLNQIALPTEIFCAKDDPIATGTYDILLRVRNPNIHLHASRFGGHLGFVHFDLRTWKLDFSIDSVLSIACDKMLSNS